MMGKKRRNNNRKAILRSITQAELRERGRVAPFSGIRTELSKYVREHYQEGAKAAIQLISAWGTTVIGDNSYCGAEAADIVLKLMELVEQRLRSIGTLRTPLDWLLMLRAVPLNDLFEMDKVTARASQRTVELLAIKYGAPLGVMFQVFNGPERRTDEDLRLRSKLVRDYPSTVKLTVEDCRNYIMFITLAVYYYELTIHYRRVGKGCVVSLDATGEVHTRSTPDLDRLVDLFDDRMERYGNLFESLGITYFGGPPVPARDSPLAFRLVPAEGADRDQMGEMMRQLGIKQGDITVRYLPAPYDLGALNPLVNYIQEVFSEQHGITWERFVSYMAGITVHVIQSFQQNGVPMEYDYDPSEYLSLGFSLVPTESLYNETFGDCFGAARKTYFPGMAFEPADELSMRNIFLKMSAIDREAIDVRGRAMSGFWLCCGDVSLLDFTAIGRFLVESLWLRLRHDATHKKGKTMEQSVAQFLTVVSRLERCAVPKKFVVGGQEKGEADVALRKGSVFILIEVKARQLPKDYDRGDFKVVRNRWGTMEKWLERVDVVAAYLANRPHGDKYDLTALGITHILPILCTPFHEWINSTATKYFLSDQIPRIATPREIAKFLNETSEEALKAHPCTIRITG